MRANRELAIQQTFGHEGGYVNNPNDKGGATKFGITAATLGAWRKLGRKATPAEVRSLTITEAADILERQYMRPVAFDQLPDGIDFMTFDFAVNSGPAQAVKTWQRLAKVAVDGIMGAHTLQGISDYVKANGTDMAIMDYQAARERFVRKLGDFKHFGNGWIARIERVRDQAFAMSKGRTFSPVYSFAEEGALVAANPADMKMSRTEKGHSIIATAIGTTTSTVSGISNSLFPLADNPKLATLFTTLTIAGVIVALLGVMWSAYTEIKQIGEQG